MAVIGPEALDHRPEPVRSRQIACRDSPRIRLSRRPGEKSVSEIVRRQFLKRMGSWRTVRAWIEGCRCSRPCIEIEQNARRAVAKDQYGRQNEWRDFTKGAFDRLGLKPSPLCGTLNQRDCQATGLVDRQSRNERLTAERPSVMGREIKDRVRQGVRDLRGYPHSGVGPPVIDGYNFWIDVQVGLGPHPATDCRRPDRRDSRKMAQISEKRALTLI